MTKSLAFSPLFVYNCVYRFFFTSQNVFLCVSRHHFGVNLLQPQPCFEERENKAASPLVNLFSFVAGVLFATELQKYLLLLLV